MATFKMKQTIITMIKEIRFFTILVVGLNTTVITSYLFEEQYSAAIWCFVATLAIVTTELINIANKKRDELLDQTLDLIRLGREVINKQDERITHYENILRSKGLIK